MNKRQKAIRDKDKGRIMTAAEWEFATDDHKELRKNKKMNNIQFKEYRNIISEGKFSKTLIAKALKIAKKSGGQMTKAWKQIEKISKGLGDDPTIADALRVANEETVAEWNTGSRRCAGGDGRRKDNKVAEEIPPAVEKDYKKAKGKKKYDDEIEEVKGVFSMSQIKKAIKIAKSMGGNMTGAMKKIERMAPGLSDHKDVMDALKAANEQVEQTADWYLNEDWNFDYNQMKTVLKFSKDNSPSTVAGFKSDMKDLDTLCKKHNWHWMWEKDEPKFKKGKKEEQKIREMVLEIHEIYETTEGFDLYRKYAAKNNIKIRYFEEVDIAEKADRNEVYELKLFIENDPRLYKSKLVPIVKNIQKKMKSGKYDHKKAPKLWMYIVKEGAKLYAKEFNGLKFSTEVHKEVAQQLADEYKDEIDAQGGTMFESEFYLQFKEFRGHEEDLDAATGNEIKKYMKTEWKIGVKASKVGSGKYMRASGKIPNKFREYVIKKFMPDAKIQDMSNINYGNIRDNYVALRSEEWDKLIKEDLDIVEAVKGKYKIDHKTFTSAVQEALKTADKAGYEVDEDDYFNTIATGPKKPGEGKTNKYSVALTKKGKPQKKALQIQIYGKGKHGFELNCYIS